MKLDCENCEPIVFPLSLISKQRGTCPNLRCLKPYMLKRHGEVPEPVKPEPVKKVAARPKPKRATRKKASSKKRATTRKTIDVADDGVRKARKSQQAHRRTFTAEEARGWLPPEIQEPE